MKATREDGVNVLVLNPAPRELAYACFSGADRHPFAEGELRSCWSEPLEIKSLLCGIRGSFPDLGFGFGPDIVAVRGAYGGERFSAPALLTPDVIEEVKRLIPQAPLHLPPLLALMEASSDAFEEAPVVLVFETAFFADLPVEERIHAANAEIDGAAELRKYGFHGIFHQAAHEHVVRRRREAGSSPPDCVLSV